MATSGPLFGSKAEPMGKIAGRTNLVGFRAGRMYRKDNKIVYPDLRKGYLALYQSEDSLIHFCWRDRSSGLVEEDLIIFPDDCEFLRVHQCTTGRVYVLKFKSSARRLFFWMQEPSEDKDSDFCKKINDILNHPPALDAQNDLHSGTDGITTLLNGLSEQQLMQLYGMAGGRSASLLESLRTRSSNAHNNTSAQSDATSRRSSSSANSSGSRRSSKPPSKSNSKTKTSASSRNLIQLADLQNYLSNLSVPEVASKTSIDEKVLLAAALNVENLLEVFTDDKKVAALQPHLPPPGEETTALDNLHDTLDSAQFKQAVTMFSSALLTGQLGPIVAQLGVNAEAVAAAEKGDLEGFLKALDERKSH